jgi:Spy/CpxP family protein refolding chaperone
VIQLTRAARPAIARREEGGRQRKSISTGRRRDWEAHMSGVASVTTATTQNQTATASGTGGSQRNPFLDPNGPFANLDLTSQQQQQIAQIFSQQSSGNQQSWSSILSQVNAILTPAQQQTLQSDVQTLRADRHHHHGERSGGSGNPLSQLDLTSSQQSQIGQIIQSAQSSGESPSAELNQIDGVLTTSQQQELISLFSAASTGTSGASASADAGTAAATASTTTGSTSTEPVVINASA